MPDGAVAPNENGAAGEAAPQQGTWQMIKGFAVRLLIMYMVMNFFRQKSAPATTGSDENGNTPAAPAHPSLNLYSETSKFDLHFYISENMEEPDFTDASSLVGKRLDVEYGDWNSGPTFDSTYTIATSFKASQALLSNGSIYLHAYLLPQGWSPDKQNGKQTSWKIVHKVKQLNKHKKRKFINTVNLLTGKTDIHPDLVQKENSSVEEILSHWHPNLTINYIIDQTPWTRGGVPAPLDQYIEFVPGQDKYYPPLYFNDYWNLQSDYMPINDTTPVLNFTLTIYPLSMMKWQFYAAQGMRNQWYNQLLGDGGADQSDAEQDALKQTLLDTNPYLLALTVSVSLVHSVFEFLAFKNDIQFWRNRKSLEGLSVRSIFFGVFQSLIVLLYILDNETNIVVIISVGVGLLIDAWKITQVINFKIDYENKWFDAIPRITYTDKSTYVESKTKAYDQMAFKYLSWVLFPLLAGYGVYSLLYHEHKGWYSWVLSMLYGFLLLFGFIMMTPQLFINYKLKSVAHLPWRMMTYKALNTFIDDLFAFVIKMPTLYRIGCFRDDIVFLIFLYQRWIYKVDPTRLNEFGTSGVSDGPPVEGEEGAEANETPITDQPKPEEEKKDD
ncbi:putative lipid scramblase CLPTM1 [Watersipora subatra]|uniref:putative lipid scramblase CLPTM1 n=1 Tax=Watersipora subatra TaxID=2589382 RepID=UPI00355B1CAF